MPKQYLLELVKALVAPADRLWVDGLVISDGRTTPFVVERSWSGPAGTYREVWSIRRTMDDIFYSSAERLISVWGMQAASEFSNRVDEPLNLEPGNYRLVFVVEGRFMGSRDLVVTAEEAVA